MTLRPHKNDIWIGESHWIEFIDLEGRYHEAVEVDSHLSALEPLWDALETQCEAACCGFDAFDFSPEGVADAARSVSPGSLCDAMDQAIRAVEKLDGTVIVSHRLNNLADKRTFLALLSHLSTCLHDA